MLYQILKPEYICPVIGEYRHQYAQLNVAKEAGYLKSQIIVLDNGEMITFIDGELQTSKGLVKTGDVLIDGSIVGDINEVVLKDRETLGSNGALIVTCDIDSTYHRIISSPVVTSRGFMDESDELYQEITEKIENETVEIIKTFLKKEYIDWNELKNNLKEMVENTIKDYVKSLPVIIPVIIDINGDNL